MIRDYNYRIKTILLLCVLLWVPAIIYHLYDLQIVNHEKFLKESRNNCLKTTYFKGRRGAIVDYGGRSLANDILYYDVEIYKPKLGGVPLNKLALKDVLSDLSLGLDIPLKELEKRFSSSYRNKDGKPIKQIPIKKKVSIETINSLHPDNIKQHKDYRKFKTIQRVKGVETRGIIFSYLDYTEAYMRDYPNDDFMTHVIGYIGFSNKKAKVQKGQIGIEKSYENDLKPKKDGVVKFYKGAGQFASVIDYDKIERKEPEHGSNVFLTVREPIQTIIEEEFTGLIEKFKPKRAYIAMANPKTGEILGMAQYPSFDLNDRSKIDQEQIKNGLLTESFEPGSTMKGISIAAALDAKVVTNDTVFDCEKGYWGKYKLKDSHASEDLTVAQIVEQSSNIGTAKIAELLGPKRLNQYLRDFGFGKPVGLNLGFEGKGVFRQLKDWDYLSISRFPMGQGLEVTPVQMLQAYCTLANKGKMMQLYIVDRIEDPNSGEVTINKPQVKKQVISEKASKDITDALCLVTERTGTARRAKIEDIKVAGKTGTSEKLQVIKKVHPRTGKVKYIGAYPSSGKKYISSFMGYLPAEDPKFVLVVVVDEAKGSYYGGTVAAPTFKSISIRTLDYLERNPLEN